jgi:hypothetical protein
VCCPCRLARGLTIRTRICQQDVRRSLYALCTIISQHSGRTQAFPILPLSSTLRPFPLDCAAPPRTSPPTHGLRR